MQKYHRMIPCNTCHIFQVFWWYMTWFGENKPKLNLFIENPDLGCWSFGYIQKYPCTVFTEYIQTGTLVVRWRLRLSKTVSSFTLFLDYVTANTCKNNVNEHHNILSSKFCKTQNVSLPILLATTIDVNCIIIGSHECTVEHKRPTSVSGF